MNQTYRQEAQAVANLMRCRVAIVRNDNKDGSPWEWVAEAKSGGFPSAGACKVYEVLDPQ